MHRKHNTYHPTYDSSFSPISTCSMFEYLMVFCRIMFARCWTYTKNMIIYVYCLLKQVLELVNHFFEQDLGGICITTFWNFTLDRILPVLPLTYLNTVKLNGFVHKDEKRFTTSTVTLRKHFDTEIEIMQCCIRNI